MTTDMNQIDQDRAVRTESLPADLPSTSEITVTYDNSTNESASQAWQSFKYQAAAFFANATDNAVTLFHENRQLFNILGWTFLILFGIRILFAVMHAIDDIPFATFIFKLVGFLYVARFIQRYLVRADNRQELAQKLDHAKAEFLGN
jgi:CAAD domains of cyanobacterial aminoacyl-tRNA synthetase